MRVNETSTSANSLAIYSLENSVKTLKSDVTRLEGIINSKVDASVLQSYATKSEVSENI